MIRRTLVVMVKEPQAGRVKTRLARGIGAANAAAFYRHATAAVLSRVTCPGEWGTILAVAPDPACASRAWPSHTKRIAQGHGDLGQRMQRVMDRLPPGPVLIIGSDIPGIRARHIRNAFAALGRNDAVFGPAPDGGYWLVGLKRFPRVLRAFRKVRWSTEHALADTRANLTGLRVAHIDTLDDIDDAADFARAGGRYGRRTG
jgi:rSAM/selenodomain-associated transferase 1